MSVLAHDFIYLPLAFYASLASLFPAVGEEGFPLLDILHVLAESFPDKLTAVPVLTLGHGIDFSQ